MRSKTLAQLVELSEAMLNGSKLQNGSGSIHSEKKLGLCYKPEKNRGAKPKKRSRSAGPEIFLGFKIDLDFLTSGCRLKD